MVAIEPHTPPDRPWRKIPTWALVPTMGFFFLVSGLALFLVLKEVGPPFLLAVNGLKSWSDVGGWQGLGMAAGLAVALTWLAGLGWFTFLIAKSMEAELKLRWKL